MDLLVGQEKSHITDPVHDLQCGDEGVVLQRSSEHAELDGVHAVQIDAGVAAILGDLGAVEDGLRVVLPPVPGRPLLHLLPRAAAEAEELVPVVLHEEQDPGDGQSGKKEIRA